MVNRLNHSTNILTASGTSSCSECVDQCYQRRCNNMCCQYQCGEFITDRTYTLIRKICHQFLKDYNRSQCREKYTVFDGGNSINVRIHRPGSRGDQNLQYSNIHEQATNEDRYRLQNTRNNVNDHYNSRNKQSKRKSDRNTDFDTDVRDKQSKGDELTSDKTKRGKIKKDVGREEAQDDHGFDKRDQKSKNIRRDRGEDNVYDEKNNDKTTKLKQKLSQAFDKRTNDNSELIDDGKIGNRRNKNKKGNVENVYNKKGDHLNINKRGPRNDDESDNGDNENRFREKLSKRGSRRDEQKNKLNKDKKYENSEVTKTKSKNVKSKYNEYIDGEDVASNDENYTGKRVSRKGKKSKTIHDNIDNLDAAGRNGTKRKSKGYRSSQKNETTKIRNSRTRKYLSSNDFDDINSSNFKSKEKTVRAITNLRNKVRQGDKVGVHYDTSSNRERKLEKLMHHKVESLYYTQSKPSRADEVKYCDYLRAHMEERELCRLCCPPQTSQLSPHLCIPQTCVQSCCPNALNSCFSETCKC